MNSKDPNNIVYPKIARINVDPQTIGLVTYVRIYRNDKWYLINVQRQFRNPYSSPNTETTIPEDIYLRAFEAFIRDVYLAQQLTKIDESLVDPRNRVQVMKPDENQEEETERLLKMLRI